MSWRYDVAPFEAVHTSAFLDPTAIIQGGGRIAEDCWIGAGVELKWGATLTAGTRIGAGSFVGPYSVCLGPGFEKGEDGRATILEIDVRLGAQVLLDYGLRLVPGVRVGAKAYVKTDLLEPGLYVGTPARRIR